MSVLLTHLSVVPSMVPSSWLRPRIQLPGSSQPCLHGAPSAPKGGPSSSPCREEERHPTQLPAPLWGFPSPGLQGAGLQCARLVGGRGTGAPEPSRREPCTRHCLVDWVGSLYLLPLFGKGTAERPGLTLLRKVCMPDGGALATVQLWGTGIHLSPPTMSSP